MNKQIKINTFIEEFGIFLESYYSSAISDVTKENKEDWISLTIFGHNDSKIELSSEGAEVTLCFGESHWHIDNYDDPCDLEEIYENTIESVMEILQCKVITYSKWTEERCLGGGSFCGESIDELLQKNHKYFKNASEFRIKVWNQELKKICLTKRSTLCKQSPSPISAP